jgi:hypothetical protein
VQAFPSQLPHLQPYRHGTVRYGSAGPLRIRCSQQGRVGEPCSSGQAEQGRYGGSCGNNNRSGLGRLYWQRRACRTAVQALPSQLPHLQPYRHGTVRYGSTGPLRIRCSQQGRVGEPCSSGQAEHGPEIVARMTIETASELFITTRVLSPNSSANRSPTVGGEGDKIGDVCEPVSCRKNSPPRWLGCIAPQWAYTDLDRTRG